NATQVTLAAPPSRARASFPVAASQTLTLRCPHVEASHRPSGLNATAAMPQYTVRVSGGPIESTCLPVDVSQTRTASFTPAAARRLPSGLKATAAAWSRLSSSRAAASRPLQRSSSATPYSLPVASRLPSGLKATANVRHRVRNLTASRWRPVAVSQTLTWPCGPSFCSTSLDEAIDLPSGDQATP